jgi:hypothetical protein
MSVTFGYDLKDGDKILEAPEWAAEVLTSLVMPGAALVNHLPFCTVSDFVPAKLVVSHCRFSAAHTLVGPILQLQTIGANRQENE